MDTISSSQLEMKFFKEFNFGKEFSLNYPFMKYVRIFYNYYMGKVVAIENGKRIVRCGNNSYYIVNEKLNVGEVIVYCNEESRIIKVNKDVLEMVDKDFEKYDSWYNVRVDSFTGEITKQKVIDMLDEKNKEVLEEKEQMLNQKVKETKEKIKDNEVWKEKSYYKYENVLVDKKKYSSGDKYILIDTNFNEVYTPVDEWDLERKFCRRNFKDIAVWLIDKVTDMEYDIGFGKVNIHIENNKCSVNDVKVSKQSIPSIIRNLNNKNLDKIDVLGSLGVTKTKVMEQESVGVYKLNIPVKFEPITKDKFDVTIGTVNKQVGWVDIKECFDIDHHSNVNQRFNYMGYSNFKHFVVNFLGMKKPEFFQMLKDYTLLQDI